MEITTYATKEEAYAAAATVGAVDAAMGWFEPVRIIEVFAKEIVESETLGNGSEFRKITYEKEYAAVNMNTSLSDLDRIFALGYNIIDNEYHITS